jgi:hypothetical protein
LPARSMESKASHGFCAQCPWPRAGQQRKVPARRSLSHPREIGLLQDRPYQAINKSIFLDRAAKLA